MAMTLEKHGVFVCVCGGDQIYINGKVKLMVQWTIHLPIRLKEYNTKSFRQFICHIYNNDDYNVHKMENVFVWIPFYENGAISMP